MPPRRKTGTMAPAALQVAMPPSWMIQEAARAAKEAVEELGRVQNSPGHCKSPVSKVASPATKTQACRCGQRILPNSQFCTACGQSLTKRGATQECGNVPNQKRQKKNTKMTTKWRCEYKHGVDIRAGPDINAARMQHALEPGEEFMVDREETGADGVLYLKLADGRGWVFDQKPNWGVICAPCSERKAAVPPVAAPKKEKAKPKPKAKEKAERPCSECSERSRSQKRVETSKQRRSSSSQRRSANDEDLASPTSTARGRSPTRRVRREPSRNQKKNQDTAMKPRETAMEVTPKRSVTPTSALAGNALQARIASARGALMAETKVLQGKAREGRAERARSPIPKVEVPRASPRRQDSPRPVMGLIAAATAASRSFSVLNEVHSTDALPAATIDKLLATPPKEPNVTARRPRRVEPTPRREDIPTVRSASSPPSSLIPEHVRAMLAVPRTAPAAPAPAATPPPALAPLPDLSHEPIKDLLVEISSEESVKEEDPLFELELRQFRQRQEMERSAKSAWQQAQRLAEEAEMQRLEDMREKTKAAEVRTREVDAALQQLRQAVAKVEERAAQRTAKLRHQQEDAEAKALQNSLDSKEDARKVQQVQDEGAEKLELLEEQLAEKLQNEETPLSCAEEALKNHIIKAKSKIQGKVQQLEKKAAAERRAVEAEAVAQRAVAPELAALKSEVLATERGAMEAEEARKRSESRASSEEARLDSFLKRLPELEVEASQKGETLIQEAEEKASRDVAEAQTQLRRCVEMASQRMLAARQSVQDAKKSTGEKIERHLDAAQAADEQVLEAMEEEKTSEERAQKLVAAARRDAPGSDALVKRFEAEQQRCQVLKRCQVIEKQLAEDLKELKEGNAQKVLAAVRASEAAVRRSKELVEAAKVDMDKHQKEMLHKREEADARVTKMDQKAQATGLWSQEVHSKFNRLLLEAKKKLLEQQEQTQQERHLQEERAKERMDTMTQRLQETEILATITEEDCDRRTVAARSEAEVAAQAATQRRAWAVEAEEAAARMAQIEMDATQREAEETCQSLQRQRDEMQKVCQQQQQEAVDNVSEARSAVEHAMASAQSRLASIQSCAASAARELQRCQAEELQIAEELEEREIDFITRVQDLEKAEMQKTCTISHCQELVVVAEQSAWRSLQQHQDAAKEKVTEEDNRAQSAEEIAEMLEGQALCAEEVACSEELKQKQQLQREHQRLCESVQEASNRTVNVQDAIHEAVHYSQKSIDELYRYLKSVGGQNSQATPSPLLPKGLDKGCPKCNVMYTPSSNFCQHCGKKLELQQPTGTPTPLGSRSPRIRKICSRSYGRVRKSRTVSTSPSAAGGNVKRAA